MSPEDFQSRAIEIIAIGASAGGMNALCKLLPVVSEEFPPVIVVQHLDSLQDDFLIDYFNRICSVQIKEAEDKEPLTPGTCYLAPPDYHLLVERSRTLSLSMEEKVNFTRPSIDLLFESTAFAFGPNAIGVLLTGANRDGSVGLREIRSSGGLAFVQDPAEAEFPFMPQFALQCAGADHILTLEQIGTALARIAGRGRRAKN
ncbi:MAG: chemotaxis protein CheB [Desulfovibrionales bacterium]